ncbi:MAG: FkbM family methyltransferase [Candidatus Pacebacteria bacterium]|nr:FkbM family methyltransferase [Candidatus Paceibacterota bacterium]
MKLITTLRKLGLRFSRFIIPHLPRGRSLAIRAALALFGNIYGGVIALPDGRKFYIDKISLVKRHLFFVDTYEEIESRIIERIVGAGDYALDVGASYGWYTVLMSRLVGDSGKVFAFELVPHIAEECRYNISLNHQSANTVIESVALGESDAVVSYIYSDDLGLGNLNPRGLTDGGRMTSGQGAITALDKYAEDNGIQKLNFIKCDVDGAEVLFLRGARKTIAKFLPAIIIEASGAHGRSSCYEIFDELSRYGYSFFSLHYKKRLRPINEENFRGAFKENILCLPENKLDILRSL